MVKRLNIFTPQVITALSYLKKKQKQFLNLLKKIASIPSPTFIEKEKITFLRNRLLKLGFRNIYIDRQGNCRGKIPSLKSKQKKILLVAHTDTVLRPEKEIKETKDYLFGHGVCDNSTGVIALLTILTLIKKFKIDFPSQLDFAFTVQEEGLGAKKGMKFILNQLKNLDAVVNLESHNIGRVTNQSVGQYRVKITVTTKKNGHSWRDFGHPNAIVQLSHLLSRFAQTGHFRKERLTFNLGQIEGGEAINTITQQASCLLEIRGLVQKELDAKKERLHKIIKEITSQEKGLQFKLEPLADSPAASFPQNHQLYQLTQEVQKFLKIKIFFDAGNNDGDVSLAKGLPTVTLGSSIGFQTHSQEEYLDKNSLLLGIKQDFLSLLNILNNL